MSEKMEQEFRRAIRYVRLHEKELRSKYGNNVIAVLGGDGVIDYDKNRFALAERLENRTHTLIRASIGTIDIMLLDIDSILKDSILKPEIVKLSPKVAI